MNSSSHAVLSPTGPKGLPYFGNFWSFASADRLDWLTEQLDEHGDIVAFTMLGDQYYLVNHPDYVKEILTKKMDQYSKAAGGFHTVRRVLGESVFTAMGDVWKRKRNLAQPQFHKVKINNLSKIMTDETQNMLDRWEKILDAGNKIDIKEEMMNITLGIVTRSLFSSGLSDEKFRQVVEVFTPILQETNRRGLYPFPFLRYLYPKRNQQYKANIATLDKIVYDIIEERRKNTTKEYTDLLQMLMDARDADSGDPLSDTELRDEVMTAFIAGHETTANALSWLWITLTRRPDIRTKIEEEVDSVLDNRIPDFKDFKDLIYTNNVFMETLRVYPPVPMLPRFAEKDDQLGPYQIKKGSTIMFSPYLLHRHPDFWDDAENFDPNRHDKSQQTKRQHAFAYLPFGGGPRICIGINFAYMEAAFIIAMVSQRFRLDLPNSKKNVRPIFEITFRPKGDVMMDISRR